jgi:uncharacterized OB-fold protein
MKGEIQITKGAVRAEFDFWVGLYLDKFLEGLEQKKFIGNKCSKCGKVYIPPRKICGDCFAHIEEYIDLPDTGILTNFTYTNLQITERRPRKSTITRMLGLVKLDGADSSMLLPVIETEPKNLKIGMKVQVVWSETIKGQPTDIKGFKPIGGVSL